MVMAAYQPDLYDALGIFVPLIVVNCIILGRAEAFASKNNVFYSVIDGLGMGVGFTLALTVIAAIRELLGNGSFLGYPVLPVTYKPVMIMVMAPGGFLTLGYLLCFFQWIDLRNSRRE
jgi:electron transport complex protein RnfE